MRDISLEDSLVMNELLGKAQDAQNDVDANVLALVRQLGGVPHGIEHEIVDQAVLNKESLNWVVEEIKEWEQYRADLKV